MKVLCKLDVRLLDKVILHIVAELVGVHADHGYLDGAAEVVVVVAQVIGGCLELNLCQLRRIVGNSEEHRLRGGNCGTVRDHVEVKKLVALILNEASVHNGTLAWVKVVHTLLVEEAMLHIAVNYAINDLGFVALGGLLEHVYDLLDLFGLYFSSQAGPTSAISVNDDLLRQHLIVLLVLADHFKDELADHGSAALGDQILLNLPSVLLFGDTRDLLPVNLTRALREIWGVSRGATDQLLSIVGNDIEANDHRVLEGREAQTIEVAFQLGVHLLDDVRHDTVVDSSQFAGPHELRRDPALGVEEVFDLRLNFHE